MRILITGAQGFVGGRVAEVFCAKGYEVVLGSRVQIESFNFSPQANIALINWSDMSSLEAACKGVDVVVHASGMNSIDCTLDPLKAFEVNALYTGRLINAAIYQKVKRLIYISTAHVYSNPLLGEISEDTCPKNLHAYATSHLAGENLVLAHKDIEGIVLRLSNAFGPPVNKNVNCWMLLVNDLCRQVVEEKQIYLKSDASQLRDFISMTDMVSAIEHFLNFPIQPNQENIFNVGGEFTITIGEMAEIISSRANILFGYKPRITIKDSKRRYDGENLKYSIEKLKFTGFQIQNLSHTEIDATLLFCKKHFEKL